MGKCSIATYMEHWWHASFRFADSHNNLARSLALLHCLCQPAHVTQCGISIIWLIQGGRFGSKACFLLEKGGLGGWVKILELTCTASRSLPLAMLAHAGPFYSLLSPLCFKAKDEDARQPGSEGAAFLPVSCYKTALQCTPVQG